MRMVRTQQPANVICYYYLGAGEKEAASGLPTGAEVGEKLVQL